MIRVRSRAAKRSQISCRNSWAGRGRKTLRGGMGRLPRGRSPGGRGRGRARVEHVAVGDGAAHLGAHPVEPEEVIDGGPDLVATARDLHGEGVPVPLQRVVALAQRFLDVAREAGLELVPGRAELEVEAR